MHPLTRLGILPGVLSLVSFAAGCDVNAQTDVILDNEYRASATRPLVVYRAQWQAVTFQTPIAPGSSSDMETTVPASPNTAYVILAPGWDPTSTTTPTSFVVMQSREGYGVEFDETLRIPVDDSTFIGNCGSGSFLPQAKADFITRYVFQGLFASLRYDAARCTVAPIGDTRER